LKACDYSALTNGKDDDMDMPAGQRHLTHPDVVVVMRSWGKECDWHCSNQEVDTASLFGDAFRNHAHCARVFPRMEEARVQQRMLMRDLRESTCSDLINFFHLRGLECEPMESHDGKKIFLRISIGDYAAEAPAAQRRLKLRTAPQLIRAMGVDQDLSKVSLTWLEFEHVDYKKWLYGSKRDLKSDFELYKRYNDAQSDVFEDDEPLADSPAEGSIFRSVDRMTIIYDIIHEEINLLRLVDHGVIEDYYPNHDEDRVEAFTQRWANIKLTFDRRRQPLGDINNYYGLTMAFWFAWQGHTVHTVAHMVPFSILFFILHTLLPQYNSLVYLANLIMLMAWTIYYRVTWKRRENALKFEWGVYEGYQANLRARPDFRGDKEPADWDRKKVVRTYPSWKRRWAELFSLFVTSIAVVLVLLIVAFFLSGSFATWLQDVLGKDRNPAKYSGVLLSLQIKVFRWIWGYVIVPRLVYLENPRTDAEYLTSVVFKLIPFNLINSYYSFFYIAFFKQPFDPAGCVDDDCGGELEVLLHTTYASLFVINLADLLFPLLIQRLRPHFRAKSRDGMEPVEKGSERLKISQDDQQRDFLAVVLELGYVVLFGSAAPLIAALCWVLLAVGLRLNAWKYTNIYQRVRPMFVEGIAMWNHMIGILLTFGRVSAAAIAFLDLRLEELDWISVQTRLILLIVVTLAFDFFEKMVEAAIKDVPIETRKQFMMRSYVEKKWRQWVIRKADESRTSRLRARARRAAAPIADGLKHLFQRHETEELGTP